MPINNTIDIRRDISAYILPDDPSAPYGNLFTKLFDPNFFLSLFKGRWPISLTANTANTRIDDEAAEYICQTPVRPLDNNGSKELRRFLIVTQKYLKDAGKVPETLLSDIPTSIIILRSPRITLRSTRDLLLLQGIPSGGFSLPIHSLMHWSGGGDIPSPNAGMHPAVPTPGTEFVQFVSTDKIRTKIRAFCAPFTAQDLLKLAECMLAEFIPNTMCGIATKIVTGALDLIATKIIDQTNQNNQTNQNQNTK